MLENTSYDEEEQILLTEDEDEKKILVVDDEETIRNLLEKIFTKEGFTVRLAENAERAFEILKNESIMLMFLDLDLIGMSGVDLCKKIRTDNYIGIIYALTGYADLFSLMKCRIAGFDDFFIKPVDVDLLLDAAFTGFKKLARWKVDDYAI